MNFKYLTVLVEDHLYEEVKIIGRDAVLHGKPAHLIAMAKKGDEAALYMLSQAAESADRPAGGPEQPYRELMKTYGQHDYLSIKKIKTGSAVLEARSVQSGCLRENDLESMLIMAKFMEAGWRLPEGHAFLEEDWEQIEMTRCVFNHSESRLPELGAEKLTVTWNVGMKQYLIEKPVRLTLEDAQTGSKCAAQVTFTIREENGARQEGICYINNVRLEDVWKEQDERFSDPQYQKRMLEHMTQEEFESMKQSCEEALEQSCPRGMYFIVVEYECTMDLNLQFYTRDYLNVPPVCHAGSATMLMFAMKSDEEKRGAHGLPLKSALIQEPVAADVKEVWAELFEAHMTVPEWEEEVEFL